ncbi:MAG: Gfo/Idh/MocA family oxidoreductase, partial [Trueperaceae bacterium]|nr:Gfo/Idh/MocA family oxidoreductase [Trueperaceae bacterium]
MSLKIGIIGVGGIAKRHYEGYQMAGAEVVAIADVFEKSLTARQQEWGVRNAFLNYEDLLNLEEVQAVSICTPNAYHHPATLAAARAGKHILCEKPISLNLEKAQEMIDVARECGVVLQIGHHMRSNGAAYKAKQMIDNGDLGNITFMRLRQAHDWAGEETVRDSFGKLANSGGGTLLDNGCHMFDLARYFAGEVESLYCQMGTLKFDVEVEDTSLVSLRFKSGTIASVENAWTATGWEEGFWIYGTKGALEYTNRWEAPVLKHRFRDSPGTTWGDTDFAVYDFHTAGVGQRHIMNFIDAIEGKREVICTGEDGLEAVRLVLL